MQGKTWEDRRVVAFMIDERGERVSSCRGKVVSYFVQGLDLEILNTWDLKYHVFASANGLILYQGVCTNAYISWHIMYTDKSNGLYTLVGPVASVKNLKIFAVQKEKASTAR